MRRAAWLTVGLAVLIALVRHDDDTDAAVYTAVAKNIVERGAWVDLSYLPTVHPHFREHLPFGFWPLALAVAIAGPLGAKGLGALWLVLTCLVVERMLRSRDAPLASWALLVLATTEPLVTAMVSARLDGALVFGSVLSAASVLSGERSAGTFARSVLGVALGCLVKGPFGGVMVIAASVARAVTEKSWRWLGFGALAAVVGALPVTAFLGWAFVSGSDWWSGYALGQLLASATGSRPDGRTEPWYPLVAIGLRAWPWLPLALVGATVPRWRTWTLTAVVAVGLLMLPSRKWWQHTLIVFPSIAVLSAVGVQVARERWARLVRLGAPALASGALLAALLLPRSRAHACLEWAAPLAAAERIAVVRSADDRHWRELAVLAAELNQTPGLIEAIPNEAPAGTLVLSPESTLAPLGWRSESTARGWALWRRGP